ncbi:MAG TPA: 30S ribosomal protein S8 [Planctomycetota bacterium]|nr:30S ribosomal protein S8 [Planctomycetota bacterium]
MMTDPVADMLTRIRNAVNAEKQTVNVPYSRLKRDIARVLRREGFIENFKESGEVPHKILRIYLRYGPDGEKVINTIERVSKPGRRVYRDSAGLRKNLVLGGLGVAVLSTSRGILSDRECRKENVGGEVICSIW